LSIVLLPLLRQFSRASHPNLKSQRLLLGKPHKQRTVGDEEYATESDSG